MTGRRVIIAGLAATRLVRAWKYEAIGERPREAVIDWLERPVMKRDPFVAGQSHSTDEIAIRPTAVKEWVGELVDCPHCLGFWLTVACVYGLRRRRLAPIIEALAGSLILSMIVQWFPGFDMEQSFPAVRVRVIGDETAEQAEP
jgi:hypothetical protein